MNFLTYLSISGMAALKVLPALGMALVAQCSPLEIFLTLSIGAFGSVVLFATFGVRIKRWWRLRRIRKHGPQKINFKKARRILRLWKRFGIVGVALLTPPVITPPIGTIIAVTLGEKLKRIYLFMLISILAWSGIFAFFGKVILDFFQ